MTAVVLDFYGTVTPGRSGAAQSAARLLQARALGVDVERFDAELTATVHERFCGAGGDVEGSLAWVCERIGATPSPAQLAEAARVRLAAERSFGEPRPEAVEVLTALRGRGLRIGLISDCSAELPAYFGELPIAPLIDAAVFSFVEGVKKPAAVLYETCCDRLGVAATDCLYVGDGGSDELDGARRVGMRAVHLDVADEQAAVVYDRNSRAWDGERITTLAQLPDLLAVTR